MTALKPIENRRVRAVASERYPLNKKCAHPECNEDAVDPHHAFPRSLIAGDSWFVQIVFECMNDTDGDGDCPRCHNWTPAKSGTPSCRRGLVIPHVTGLCRAHHDDVEEHRAWIKLEDGEWRWYDRKGIGFAISSTSGIPQWELLGALNPQPGSVEGKPKRKKFQGEARRRRTTISIKVPQDEKEDGAGIYEDLLTQAREALGDEEDKPAYYVLVAALYFLVANHSREEK